MSEGQVHRRPPAAICPPPPPSQPISFDGNAYSTPKDRQTSGWVWREPKSQRDRIEAKKSRRKPIPKRAKTVPPPKPDRNPNVHAYDDAYFEQVRKEEREKLLAPSPPVDLTEQRAGSKDRKAVVPQGTWSTPDQWNRGTKKGREAFTKARGTFKSSSGAARTSREQKPLGVNMRHVKIPSERDKAKTGKKSAIAAKRETKRSLLPEEIEAAYEPIATSAIERFKASRVTNLECVLRSLHDLLSLTDGRGKAGLVAYAVRFMRNAVGSGPTEERVIDKRFLHSAATKALGELIKRAWHMMGPDESEDVTDDPEVRRRVGAARRRSISSSGEFKIRLHQTGDGREVFFLLTVERSGRMTLHGIMSSRR